MLGGGGGAASGDSSPLETSVQSEGRGGSGGYTVGFRLMSHGCVFFGRVFMWCEVAFFFGLDEHSIASPPSAALGTGRTMAPPRTAAKEGVGEPATWQPNRAETDISLVEVSTETSRSG